MKEKKFPKFGADSGKTIRVTLGDLYKLATNDKSESNKNLQLIQHKEIEEFEGIESLSVPAYQRCDKNGACKEHGATYYKAFFSWLIHLIWAICHPSVNSDNSISNHLAENIAISLDRVNHLLFLDDGAHRILNYLIDFIDNNRRLKEDAEGLSWDETAFFQKYILPLGHIERGKKNKIERSFGWDDFSDDMKKDLLNMPVIVSFIESSNPSIRAIGYIIFNSGVKATPNDMVRVCYFDNPMYNVLDSYQKSIEDNDNGIRIRVAGKEKAYTTQQSEILANLVNYKSSSFLSMMCRHLLVSEINPNQLKELWPTSSSQAGLNANLLDATKNWSTAKCERSAARVLDSLCKIGKFAYDSHNKYLMESKMRMTKGAMTLFTGYLYAMKHTDNKDEVMQNMRTLIQETNFFKGETVRGLRLDACKTSHYCFGKVEEVAKVLLDTPESWQTYIEEEREKCVNE